MPLVGLKMEHGRYTARMGEAIEEWLGEQGRTDLKVCYDHGTEGMSKVAPYFGSYSRASTLAFVDCAVVDTSRRQALVLCEIEEEGASPKKMIGDIGNLLMAEWLCIGGQRYSFAGARLFLGVCVRGDGQGEAKAKAICRRLTRMVGLERLRGMTIRVRAKTDPKALVEDVQDQIQMFVTSAQARSLSTSSRRASPPRPCRLRTDGRRPQP